jgi:hypothetical protein
MLLQRQTVVSFLAAGWRISLTAPDNRRIRSGVPGRETVPGSRFSVLGSLFVGEADSERRHLAGGAEAPSLRRGIVEGHDSR